MCCSKILRSFDNIHRKNLDLKLKGAPILLRGVKCPGNGSLSIINSIISDIFLCKEGPKEYKVCFYL